MGVMMNEETHSIALPTTLVYLNGRLFFLCVYLCIFPIFVYLFICFFFAVKAALLPRQGFTECVA